MTSDGRTSGIGEHYAHRFREYCHPLIDEPHSLHVPRAHHLQELQSKKTSEIGEVAVHVL